MTGHLEDITIDRLVAGGNGMGRLSDGRVAFVPGTIAGEKVSIELTQQKKDMARGQVVSLLTASEDRVDVPCPRVADGCGGCDWQHLSVAAQHRAKVAIVVDAFTRIGKLAEAESLMRFGGAVGDDVAMGWRTTVRAAVNRNGRAGFYRIGTHDVCTTGPCPVTHPVIASILDAGRFVGSDEVLIRVGLTANHVVVAADQPGGVTLPPMPSGWTAAIVAKVAKAGGASCFTERIAGVDLRVSVGSFFQSCPAAAELLVSTVSGLLAEHGEPDVFVDLYGGIGLFACTVGRSAKEVVVVESSPSAIDDARWNLGEGAVVHRAQVEEWEPPRLVRRSRLTHVVADPARTGLGREGVAAAISCHPDVLVLVSCDAAAGARDARLLIDAGYELDQAVVLDLFPHTSHVEVVTRYLPKVARVPTSDANSAERE
jgi:23S rRNA (uracil1939-C5)-methyltransferase